jgi:hypothetical protein
LGCFGSLSDCPRADLVRTTSKVTNELETEFNETSQSAKSDLRRGWHNQLG